MGGDGQPQTQAAVFTRHVRYRMPLARAIEAPRWLLGRTWGAAHGNLRLEAGFEDALLERLRVAGHPVEVLPEPHSDLMGHAGAVVLHPDGTFEAGHDPRADGGAAVEETFPDFVSTCGVGPLILSPSLISYLLSLPKDQAYGPSKRHALK